MNARDDADTALFENTGALRETEPYGASKGTPANGWPPRPAQFLELLTPVEAAQYLRLDETGHHTPESACRTLTFWRDRRELRGTKYARRVWFRRIELDRFLERKTEE